MLKRRLIVYTVLVLYTVGPILPMVLASAVASRYGCLLDESGVSPCVVAGRDLGGILSFMFVSAWFALLTLPSGVLALIGYSAYVTSRRKVPPTA